LNGKRPLAVERYYLLTSINATSGHHSSFKVIWCIQFQFPWLCQQENKIWVK
jgi:hypothetical protein